MAQTTTLAAVEERLKEYVLAAARRRGLDLDDLPPEEDFVERQIFDSLSLLDFILEVERVTGRSIPGEDVVPENFGSLGAISRYLRDEHGMR